MCIARFRVLQRLSFSSHYNPDSLGATFVRRYFWRVEDLVIWPNKAMPPASRSALATAGHTTKDCVECPQRVVIAADSFRTGSPD